MGFVNMKEYSENNLPQAGSATEYVVCESISKYHPYDISGVVDAIDSTCSEVISNSNDYCNDLKDKITSLGDEWGQKFISIDEKDIGIVVPEQFQDDYDNITNHIQEQVDRCKTLVSDVSNRLDEVKLYVQKLEENLKTFNDLRNKKNSLESSISNCEYSISNEYSKEQVNSIVISNLQVKKNSYETELASVNLKISQYNMIDEPDGQWIVE